jgi:uncharacterized protein (TIGR00369 family)
MTSIWKRSTTIEELHANARDTAIAHMGIELLELGDNWVRGRMPVDARTHQPMGLLHGGASVLLAETLGSTGASLCVEPEQACVGLEINANHLRSVTSGWVIGTAEAVHIGRTTQVWSIRIEDEAGRLVCLSRLTMAVVARR